MGNLKTIVKFFRHGRLVGQAEFTDYDSALTYLNRKLLEGNKCLLLNQIGINKWSKSWYNPDECM